MIDPQSSFRRAARAALAAGACLLAGCGALLPKPEQPVTEYSFDATLAVPALTQAPATTPAREPTRTLVIGVPRAAAGYDSEFIIYLRQPAMLEHYTRSVWTDTPMRMLAPLLATTLERSGAFRAVVQSVSSGLGELRLDTELVRLQHEFYQSPSRVRLTLRAHLIDNTTRRVIAWKEFDVTAPAATEDAHGGVIATHEALRTVLEQLRAFCVAHADAGTPRPVDDPKSPNRKAVP